MKTICFFNSTKFWGGGEKTHLEFAKKLRNKGYEVFFIASKNTPIFIQAKANQFKVCSLKINNTSFINPYKLIKLSYYLQKNKVDTFLFSNSNDLKIGGLSARMVGVKRIVYLRGVAAVVKNNAFNRFLFKSTLHHIIASSEETKKAILKHLRSTIADDKVSVIYRGIDIDEYDQKLNSSPQTNYKTEQNEIILGNAGRLSFEKAQHHLIDLAIKLKKLGVPFKILIAGEGGLRESLEQKIAENKLEKEVILLGFVEDIPGFLKSIDVLVFTSTTEGFGNILIETGVAGKTIVCFNMSTNPEIFEDNKNGILIEYPNIDSMAERIRDLYNKPEELNRIGKNHRAVVEKRFNLDNIMDEIEGRLLSI